MIDLDMALSAFAAGFPHFMLHGALTLALVAAGVGLYVWLTPHKEVALIREGNAAAGLSLAAVIVGLAVPLSAALASSVSLADLALWSAPTLLLQLIAFRVVDLVLRDLPARIAQGEMAAACVLAAVKVSAALVLAAALMG